MYLVTHHWGPKTEVGLVKSAKAFSPLFFRVCIHTVIRLYTS
jgi:hypothetical protein